MWKQEKKFYKKFAYFIATFDGNQYMERQSYFIWVKVRFSIHVTFVQYATLSALLSFNYQVANNAGHLPETVLQKQYHKPSTAESSRQQIQKQMK